MPVIPAAHLLAEFVDRSRELDAFRGMIDGHAPPILRISGSGGMGKSSLLSRFMSECSQREMSWIHLEWRDSRRYSYLDIMRRLRQESDPELFHLFNDRVNFYTVPQYNLKIDLQGASIQDVKVQVGGLLGGNAGNIHIGHNIQIPDSMVNVLRPDQSLNEGTVVIEITAAFVPCLRAVLETRPLVVILDATEKADAPTRAWIQDELFTRIRDQEFSRLFLIEAGRDLEPLDPTFNGIAEDRTLSNLEEIHVQEYLARKGLSDPTLARFVHSTYKGHPQQIAIVINNFLKAQSQGTSAEPAASLLSQFQNFQASARAIETTGDAALDLLLSTSDVHFSDLVRRFAVPHWFTLESILLAGGSPEDYTDLLSLPFVRLHPLGHTYHDEVRRVLRKALLDRDLDFYLGACRALHAAADGWIPVEANDETDIERLYLWLGSEPAAAFAAVEERIHAARDARQFNLFDTLVHVLEEQTPILDDMLRQKVEYYRGLLLYDQRAYSDSLEILARLPFDRFDEEFATAARFRVGLALERCGSWKEAERYYRNLLKGSASALRDPRFRAKVFHRQAQAAFSLRDLGAAERYARRSLLLDEQAGTRYGQAVNLRLLGVIHEKLRDRQRGRSHLEKALALFRELEIAGEVARSLNDLGNLLISFGEFEEAGRVLEEAAASLAGQGDSYGLAFVYANLGKVAVGTGRDTEEALRDYNAALTLFQQFRDKINAAKVLRNLAIASEYRHHREEAAAYMTRALAELPSGNALRSPWESELRRLRGRQTAPASAQQISGGA